MRRERVRALLEDVAAGRATIEWALSHLDHAPVEDLGFANIDHHRALRAGFPEVVFGEGKTAEQTLLICERLAAKGDGFLVTRTNDLQRIALADAFPGLRVNALARTVHLQGAAVPNPRDSGTTLIVTAGTSDLPVAEEAAETLVALGFAAGRLSDVGVAGIHRLLSQHDALRDAAVVIVVAGMDGALPSVVGGLVRVPVIAVPTSVGYGASFEGLSALLAMLNSCAAGVTVCNIDNGFGAAMAAARILSAR
ncbi:MAG TPA: nickel pincer cofactor biosynthesis protein LarB [Gemmatimonadaceae bacterium]